MINRNNDNNNKLQTLINTNNNNVSREMKHFFLDFTERRHRKFYVI